MSEFEFDYFLVQTFIPVEHVQSLIAELQKQDVIHISVSEVTNYYKRIKGDVLPFKGPSSQIGEFIVQNETKVEVKTVSKKLGYVLHAISYVHPYEKPTINVMPLV